MSNVKNKQILSRNLKRYLKKNKLNVKQFSSHINVKYTTVVDWVNGKTYPRMDKIDLMADFFNIQKCKLIESQFSLYQNNYDTNDKFDQDIYICGYIISSTAQVFRNVFKEVFYADLEHCNMLEKSVVQVIGNSMLPYIKHGDLLYLDKTSSIHENDIILFSIENKEYIYIVNDDATMNKALGMEYVFGMNFQNQSSVKFIGKISKYEI
ncbi:hypothetical protein BG262_06935 [Floricoccus penangensis]|uniref:HTH cro/C1-type domain-containing protein n=1 Tax=Floricoccus penangensis TaxID=1859475 RepID=A0A9Q5JE72_9LACT|nr:S24 family peptidase [Floricoccus penangensis]OFI45726.1 hypothetical protein BG262_06935 [Floricoccus penangensis]